MTSFEVDRPFKVKVAHSIAWTLLGRSSGMVTSFVVFVTLARLLTLSQFGVFALASVFVDITRIIATSGWTDAIVRDPDQDRELMDTAFWASLGLGVIVACIAIAFARSYAALIGQPEVAPIIIVLAPLVPFSCLATVPIGRLLQSFGYKAVAVRTSAASLIAGLVAMGAAAAGWGVWSLVAQAIVADVINVGSAWAIAPVDRPSLSFSWRRWRRLSGFTINVLGAQLMWLLLIRVSELFIARDLGAAAVGAYRIGFRLFELIGQAMLSPVAAVALPVLSRFTGDRQRLSDALNRIIGLLSLFVFPLMAGFGVTGDIVVPMLFGSKWTGAVPVTQILMLLMVPFLVSFFEGAVFAAVGRTSALSKIALVQLMSTTLLTLIVAPYGLVAIAAAYVARSYLTLIYELRLFRIEAGVDTGCILKQLLPALVSTAGMIVSVLLLRSQLSALHCGPVLTVVASVIFGGVTYLLVLATVFRRAVIAHWRLVMSSLPERAMLNLRQTLRRVRQKLSRSENRAPSGGRSILRTFEQAAQHADLVTFDLFDTLVERNFRAPTDLFEACEARLRREQVCCVASFAVDRVRAEQRAREIAALEGRREVTLDQIYQAFSKSWTTEVLSEAKEIELELESSCLRADEDVMLVARRLIASGKRVVVLSDMYLPKTHLEAVLSQVGLVGYEELQVSCECGLSKADGSAWTTLRGRHGLQADARVVHVGDNPTSDGQRAVEAGVEAFLLPTPHDRLIEHRLTGQRHWFMGSCESLLTDALRRHTEADDDDRYWIAIAYLVALPTALGFCAFIDGATRERGSRPFFLARDGLLFKKVFDAAYRPVEQNANDDYIYASRRCLNVASIETMDEAALDFLMSGVDLLSPIQYLQRIDVDVSSHGTASKLEMFFADPHRPIEAHDRERMRGLLRCLAPTIEARAAFERQALLRYLEASDLLRARSTVVDLGWHGSLQRSISRLANSRSGRPPEIDGLYLGTLSRSGAASEAGCAMRGWLFDDGNPGRIFTATVGQSIEVVELLFSAPHPSLSHMRLENGRPHPVFVTDGHEAHRLKIAALIHSEVEAASRALRPLVPLISGDEWIGIVTRQITTYLGSPDRSDVARCGSVWHNEGFGVSRYKPIVPPHTRSLHPARLRDHISNSFWPAAARVGLGHHQVAILMAFDFLRRLRRGVSRRVSKSTLTLSGSKA